MLVQRWEVFLASNFVEALITLKKGTQLIKYSRKGKPKFCPFRISFAGADPNVGPDGFKPLSFAAEILGKVQIIKLLVEAGADPNVKNFTGALME